MADILIFLLQYYMPYMYGIPFCVLSYAIYFSRSRRLKEEFGKDSVPATVFFILGIFTVGNMMSWVMINHDFKLYRLFPDDPSIGKYLVKLVAGLIVSFFVPKILCLVMRGYKNLSNSQFLVNNRFSICISLFSLLRFILTVPERMNGWGGIWFAMDYTMGFGPRMMIGSILRLFYRDYLDPQWVYHVMIATEVFIILLISVILGLILKKAYETDDRDLKAGTLLLVFCYIASPGWISSTWCQANFARFENYTMVVAILGVILFSVIPNYYLKYFVITILSVFSISIYHGDLFLYYPLMLAVIIYDVFNTCITEDGRFPKFNPKKIIVPMISVAVTAAGFFVFQFVNTIRYKTYDELMNAIHEYTYFEDGGSLYFELFTGLSTAYQKLQLPFLMGDEMPREKTFLTFLIVLPLSILFLSIYLKCFELMKKKGKSLFNGPYLYYSLLFIAALPQFMLNTDWGRWMIVITVTYFGVILYLCYKKDPIMCEAVCSLGRFAQNHRFMTGLVILWLAGLDKFGSREFIAEAENFMVTFFGKGG